MASVTVNAQREMSKNMFLDKGMSVADMTEFERKKFEGCIKFVESEKKYMGMVNGANIEIGKGAGSGDSIITYVNTIAGSSFQPVMDGAEVAYYMATVPATQHGLKLVVNERLVDASFDELDVSFSVNMATQNVEIKTYSTEPITGNYNLILIGTEK